MMKVLAALLAFTGYVTAFTPSFKAHTTSSLQMASEDVAGVSLPMNKFDPLSLETIGSAETYAWFRAAELKHSRVAMLATTGYIVQAAGIHWPGMLSKTISFESLSGMKPFDAWNSIPEAGKSQILFTIFCAELYTEAKGTHYMKGGGLPTIVFPPINFDNVDPEVLKVKRTRELNNGRLAMIAIMSFIAANNIPGSVPALNGIPMFN